MFKLEEEFLNREEKDKHQEEEREKEKEETKNDMEKGSKVEGDRNNSSDEEDAIFRATSGDKMLSESPSGNQ